MESSQERAREFVRSGKHLWYIVYNNINFTFRKASQRLHNALEQVNATTSAVIALPACLATTVFVTACEMLNQKQKSGGHREMTFHKLVPTLEQQSQLRSAFYHAVRSLLPDNLDGLSRNTKWVKDIRKQLAAEKPTIRQLDGTGEKTTFYPLPRWMRRKRRSKGPSGWLRRWSMTSWDLRWRRQPLWFGSLLGTGCVEQEVRLPDVSHYPATAYSEPMIRWRLLAAADVQRALFSSPSVDRPMCAKQHHT